MTAAAIPETLTAAGTVPSPIVPATTHTPSGPASPKASNTARPDKATLEKLETALTALREEVRADLGQRDADYIRRVIAMQRGMEIIGRGLIHFSLTPVGWLAGSVTLGLAKIIDNMEIGHNVMHGQYDWMNDPAIHSTQFEWDTACDGESWKRTHNHEHHTYTNILGKDRDYGYGLMRLTDDVPWEPRYRFQFLNYLALSGLFQWGVALHELETERLTRGEVSLREKIPFLKAFGKKASKQVFKDYLFFPALAGPMFWKVALGNGLANLIRNLWASTIIFCGHFTEDADTFTEAECQNESKGHWYYRQIRGSSNFEGGRWLHFLSGHLSHQVEHHLFPDIPAHRYPAMAKRVRTVCEELGIPYNTGSFYSQYKTVLQRIIRYSAPQHHTLPGVLA